MSHTPGPWKITESANAIVVMGPNAQHVVIIPLFKEYAWSKEEWEGLNLEEKNKVSIANARLVAAAPELLECLQHIQGIVSESQGVAGWHQNGQIASWDELGLREEIDAVLAKVRGEEA